MTTKAEALAAKDELLNFLLERGWKQRLNPVYPWIDPKDETTKWTFWGAIEVALKREPTA